MNLRTLQYVFAAVLVLYVLVPLALALAISFNPDNTDVLATMGSWRALWPAQVGFDNYVAVWTDPFHPFARYLFNTVFITAAVVVCSVLVNSGLAFAMAWGRGRWRAWAAVAVVALIAVPAESLMLPRLLLVSRAGVLDTYTVQIVPVMASALFVFLFYQFFTKMPRALIDAARVDGLSLVRMWWHIGLPASIPATTTVAVLQFLAVWNSYLWPVMTTRTAQSRPLSVAMAAWYDSQQIDWGSVMAFAVCAALPAIAVFVYAQRHFIAGITGVSLKE